MVLPASAFPMSTFPFQNQPVHPFLAAAVTQPGGTNLFPMFGPLKVEPHAWGIISGATEDPRSGSPGSSMSSLSPIQLTPSPSENGDAALSPPPTNPHAAAPVAPTSRPCSTVSEPAQGSSPLPHSLTNLLAPAPRTSTPALPPIKQEGCPNVTLTPQLVPFSSTSEFQPYFVPSFQFPVPHYNYVPPPPGPWDFSWAQPKQEPTPAQPPTAPIRPGRTRTREKYRMVYTDFQRLELEKEFHSSKYITTARKTQLAQSLGLTDRQIKIWFQNRRAKHRKKGNMINPPTNLSALNQHSLNVKEQIQQVESPVLPDNSTSAEAIRFERLQPMEVESPVLPESSTSAEAIRFERLQPMEVESPALPDTQRLPKRFDSNDFYQLRWSPPSCRTAQRLPKRFDSNDFNQWKVFCSSPPCDTPVTAASMPIDI